MEPYSTLDQISALGALGLGCCCRASSRRFRRGLAAGQAAGYLGGMGLSVEHRRSGERISPQLGRGNLPSWQVSDSQAPWTSMGG
jgi:hypothetical protein